MKNTSQNNSKKKLGFVIASIITVVAIISASLVMVLAATTQSLSTSISVSYVSKEVSGKVSATYQVKNGEEVDMVTSGGASEIDLLEVR